MGIIPARAGFTAVGQRGRGRRGDHPRSRGVYNLCSASLLSLGGSSPLARGLLNRLLHYREYLGIIPARAGFTRMGRSIQSHAGDHPRSRGVYHAPSQRASDFAGSSPLARGLLFMHMFQITNHRIIPARAGFTRGGLCVVSHVSDHPRSRGVYRDRPVRAAMSVGSSPLARGLRYDDRRGPCRARIIPARAGFTRSSRSPPTRASDHPRSRGVYTGMTIIRAYG